MCTVIYIPKKDNSFIGMSYRDEALGRKTITPCIYNIEGVKMLFPRDAIAAFTYEGIEPFTIIAVNWINTLTATELVWDGGQAYISSLGHAEKIGSLSTSFSVSIKEKRKRWFAEFSKQTGCSDAELLDFHTTAGEGNAEIGLKMNRGLLGSVSITQIEKIEQECPVTYHDFQKEEVHDTVFEILAV